MKKTELVIRDILYNVIEKKNRTMTQLGIANALNISLSTVNLALAPLKAMGAVTVKLKNFVVVDTRKILFYWASIRKLEKDIIYQTRADMPVKNIESLMPSPVIFGAYSAYKFKFKDVPADYSEMYVYVSEEEISEIKNRFPPSKNPPNLFVLKKDLMMNNYAQKNLRITTEAQIFVDLWNLKEWYAKEFLKALEERLKKDKTFE
ncbi:winged helix-turn-helix transcriptional regulator [Candidatus Woesearchaeota archaeon]|nr:winged helix-turn-helix transcriptional regulator [Candidatus Woesearchaeota archaeon]